MGETQQISANLPHSCVFLSSNLDECAVWPGLIFIRAPVFFRLFLLFKKNIFHLLPLNDFFFGSRLLDRIKLWVTRAANYEQA